MSYVVYLTDRRRPDVRAASRFPRNGRVAATLLDHRTARFQAAEDAERWLHNHEVPPRWRATVRQELPGRSKPPRARAKAPCATKS
jgi:hypothetical protein